MIKGLFIHSIREVFSNPDTNFLALYGLPELYVFRGNNNLDTCFQYAVKDYMGDHLLTVKVYDKILNLFAREGSHSVGCRIAEVIGSRHHLTIFNNKKLVRLSTVA